MRTEDIHQWDYSVFVLQVNRRRHGCDELIGEYCLKGDSQKKKKSLLAPTGALVLMMVYYIYIRTTFSDVEHLCLSILLQVSL